MATLADLVARAGDAYESLVTVGEEIDDEWQYIADLSTSWLAALAAVAADRGDEPAAAEVEAAVDRLIDEIGRISDPHRAIDWLSTFPLAALLALEPAR